MATQRLEIGDGFHLAPIGLADKEAYLKHFADPVIGRMLLAVPVPYTEQDADNWIAHRLRSARGHEIQFGIRRSDGFLIGGIGLVEGRSHAIYCGEIGYWLAAEYRGRGLMPRTIRRFCRLHLSRTPAPQARGHDLPIQSIVIARAGKGGFYAGGAAARERPLAGWRRILRCARLRACLLPANPLRPFPNRSAKARCR